MKKKIQNKLGTYLAVTAGVGCAASVAEGAIVVVDLSGLSTGLGQKLIPGGDGLADFVVYPSSEYGYLSGVNYAMFRSNTLGVEASPPGTVASFPVFASVLSAYWITEGVYPAGNFVADLNWVAFQDSENRFGWLSFTLHDLDVNDNLPISSFGHFVYDPASTSAGTAITLQAAEAAVAAVPEPSSLVLFALGATGLAARRQRKKAA